MRRVVGLCAQDAHAFDSTVRENLRLARPGCDDEVLRRLVLHGGRVVERGRHGELLSSHGRYRALWSAGAG